ncbi:SIR2 family protein [Massilia sp. P8910]|uniref:SIR2 family protein n=1 Tax=Massilia antarctica TaxID=2765360 RepID=UPI001E63D64F|nr:SIR2 family protein [Massilia antarctica]MCE3606445.1 SIR2 family protein [Massilia antarctica]
MTSFLAENSKSLVHLRKRLHEDKMLAMCLGAGVSADLKFPMWGSLVDRIAAHRSVNGTDLLTASEALATRAQLLYQRYKRNNAVPGLGSTGDSRLAATGWLRIVHECLYAGAIVDDAGVKAHPYLWDLMPLVQKSAMTINYNFDDSLERLLYKYNEVTRPQAMDRGFEVVWKPSTQFRRNSGVIYHPNGFLPYQMSDGFSDDITFMEQEFADQLIDVGAGHYASLLNHFTKHTVIFFGLSLSDATLKHVLRISARNNPGHFHYIIQWCAADKPSQEQQEAIREANFSLYNLVTLFFTTTEMRQFTELLVMNQENFNGKCDSERDRVRSDFRYYLTGPVGAGKSTMLEIIRTLNSFDEWVDRKDPLLAKPQESLSDSERRTIDDWINLQFRKKNRRISESRQAISLIDRSPIDPLYFVANESNEAARAAELIEWMVTPNNGVSTIVPGHLIILTCESVALQARLLSREKKYTIENLNAHNARLTAFWEHYAQVTVIDTTRMSVPAVVKRILQIILFEPYNEVPFNAICQNAASKTPISS